MSKTTLAVLVNDILNSLGFKMIKIEFNNEEIAKIEYKKDEKEIKNMCITYISFCIFRTPISIY